MWLHLLTHVWVDVQVARVRVVSHVVWDALGKFEVDVLVVVKGAVNALNTMRLQEHVLESHTCWHLELVYEELSTQPTAR